MQTDMISTLSITLIFAAIFWMMIFIETYVHFPKMGRKQRLEMSLSSATILSTVLLVFVYIALYFVLKHLL